MPAFSWGGHTWLKCQAAKSVGTYSSSIIPYVFLALVFGSTSGNLNHSSYMYFLMNGSGQLKYRPSHGIAILLRYLPVSQTFLILGFFLRLTEGSGPGRWPWWDWRAFSFSLKDEMS